MKYFCINIISLLSYLDCRKSAYLVSFVKSFLWQFYKVQTLAVLLSSFLPPKYYHHHGGKENFQLGQRQNLGNKWTHWQCYGSYHGPQQAVLFFAASCGSWQTAWIWHEISCEILVISLIIRMFFSNAFEKEPNSQCLHSQYDSIIQNVWFLFE